MNTKWPIQLYVNGEKQINVSLTSEQISEVIKLINKLKV